MKAHSLNEMMDILDEVYDLDAHINVMTRTIIIHQLPKLIRAANIRERNGTK